MKRKFTLLMMIAIVFSLCACGKEATPDTDMLVTFSDGSTERVTAGEMIKFPSKYNLASVKLTGQIDSIMKEYSWYDIVLENGIELSVNGSFVEKSNIDIGNYVTVEGKMIVTDYSITVGQPTKEENSIAPFDYITYVK